MRGTSGWPVSNPERSRIAKPSDKRVAPPFWQKKVSRNSRDRLDHSHAVRLFGMEPRAVYCSVPSAHHCTVPRADGVAHGVANVCRPRRRRSWHASGPPSRAVRCRRMRMGPAARAPAMCWWVEEASNGRGPAFCRGRQNWGAHRQKRWGHTVPQNWGCGKWEMGRDAGGSRGCVGTRAADEPTAAGLVGPWKRWAGIRKLGLRHCNVLQHLELPVSTSACHYGVTHVATLQTDQSFHRTVLLFGAFGKCQCGSAGGGPRPGPIQQLFKSGPLTLLTGRRPQHGQGEGSGAVCMAPEMGVEPTLPE